MNLENYISQLLYRYQCVTVPGFGAFLTETQSAQHNQQTNFFCPPKKIISFNPLVKNNDGLLANHIVKTEKIPYESALNYIHFEVESWNEKLKETRQFSIKNVGDFYLGTNNKIVFEPYSQLNYLTNSFGLNSFVSPVIKREYLETEPQTTIENDTTILLPEKHSQPSYYLKYASVLLISGGLGFSIANQLYTQNIERQEYVVNQKIQKQIENKIQTATFLISKPLGEAIEIQKNYHVVAGFFKIRENATKEVAKLKAIGYPSKILPANKKGLYPVVYNSYATYNEAKISEYEIEKELHKNSWILTQELE